MPDLLGYRAKWGLVVPVRNTVCETELHQAVPAGITINTARAVRSGPVGWTNDQEQLAMARGNREAEPAAIEQLRQAEPDYLIIGEGGFSFSAAEHEAMAKRYEAMSGVGVSTSARAYRSALETLGIRKLAVLTIRLPDTGIVSGGLWQEYGYEVAAAKGMNTRTTFEIVNAQPEALRAALIELAQSPAEVILATGSNFALMRLADEVEREIGKPILHVNTVLLWYALRQSGFDDRIEGCGSLLRDY